MELIRVKYGYIPICKHLVMHKYMSAADAYFACQHTCASPDSKSMIIIK